MKEISVSDLEKAQEALLKADINFRNTYCLTPNGAFYMSESGGCTIKER